MKKKRKWNAPQSTLRERLERRAARKEVYFGDSEADCKQIRWENLPVTLIQPMREHMFQKTVAAIIVVLCLGLFSLINQPFTNRVAEAVHYLTVHQMKPSDFVEVAKPVMQTVRELNWRREPPPKKPESSGSEPETMAVPVNGVLASPYGARLDATGQNLEMHYGIDVAAEAGSPVFAAFSGTVTLVKEHPVYGKTIYIAHPNEMVTIYGRIESPTVLAGDSVLRGQQIAVVAVSAAGESHLHFEVWQDKQPVDPEKFLSETE